MARMYTFPLLALCVGLLALHCDAQTKPRFFDKSFDNKDGSLSEILTTRGIREDTKIGDVIGQLACTDPDPNTVLTYSGKGQTLFVDSSGQVRLVRSLDNEINRENSDSGLGSQALLQTFVCTDESGLSASVQVKINVGDYNDNPPRFDTSTAYSVRIPESAAVGDQLGSLLINITDADESANAEVTVTCYEGDRDAESILACQQFEVRSRQIGDGKYTASIFLKKKVDYETRRGYTMTLLAKDRGQPNQPQLNSTANVLIEVTDTQDSGPEFLNIPLTLYIREESAIGTESTPLISAQDQDQGSPRPIKIVMETDTKNLFRLGDTRLITETSRSYYAAPVIIRNRIDRETLNNLYVFRVKAIEMEGNVETDATVLANVTVNIQDTNDNKPEFSGNNYVATLAENENNQTLINTQVPGLNIQITDEDEASNAQYNVVIADQSFLGTFRVFPEGKVTGSVSVNLLVVKSDFLDYDNPTFRTHVVKIEARSIGAVAGSQTTSTATVTINLQDLNDNSPEFSAPSYTRSIREDAAVGTPIIKITATDRDEGTNGNLTYSLRGTDLDMFNVDTLTGQITLAKKLDFEDQNEFPIFFVATDNGQPPRVTTRTLTIRVTNYNDLGPRFSQVSYGATVLENSLGLVPPIQVTAFDPEDPTGFITYSIADGNIGNAFQINPNNGQLTLTRLLDYDETPNRSGTITLTVQATDVGQAGQPGLSTNATVTIIVQDQNNHDPKFNPLSYTATISETELKGKSIAQVFASDDDYGSNGEIGFTIDRGGLDNFEINPVDGKITISARALFDVESTSEYRLVIYAIDKGGPPRTGTATVTVTVTDSNNKNPVIESEIYLRNIRDDASTGSFVIDINATDADSNSDLQYELPLSLVQARDTFGSMIDTVSPFDFRRAFVVNPTTGVVTTNTKLDRSSAAIISFVIRATDQNAVGGEQTATTSVIVTVLGTSIAPIRFSAPWTPLRQEYTIPFTERRDSSVAIITLNARDPVCGCILQNYEEVSESSPNDYFTVNRLSGEVRLQKELDYEIAADRRLQVVVRAVANDSRVATATVNVEVLDDNDNKPEFNEKVAQFTIGESEKYPKSLGSIKATDEDSGSFGEIEYSISGQGAEDFQIFSDTGMIIVAQGAELDYETTRVYNLQAIANDNPRYLTTTSKVRLQSSIPLTITIVDENDNAPSFRNNTEYNFFTVESYSDGTTVGQVVAKDDDDSSTANAQIVYFIEDATAEGIAGYDASRLFNMNSLTGVITTRGSLRGTSLRSPYTLTVKAQDRGAPPLSNTVQVKIFVSSGQLDDGRPYFSYPDVDDYISLMEHSPLGTEVLTVLARPRTKNAVPNYSFLTSSNQDYNSFNINPVTGNITVASDIDRELQAQYTLIVAAEDSINKTTGYRLINVNILDRNDNYPSFKPDPRYKACTNRQLPVPVEITIEEESPKSTLVYTVRACDPDVAPNNQHEYYPEMSENNPQCKTEMEKNNFLVTKDGNVYTDKVLNREVQETYLVCVRVVEINPTGRRKRAVFNYTGMPDNDRVAFIEVTLRDINDNRPIFPYRQLRQVLLSSPESESIVQVKAIDFDNAPFNQVRYSILNIQYYDKSEDFALPGAFVINPETGFVSIGLRSYTDFSGRYFKLDILAEDVRNSNLNGTTELFIYIFDKQQSMRFVLDDTPDKGILKADSILQELNSVTGTTGNDFKLQQISYHTSSSGITDVTMTDICFVVISNDRVLSVQQGQAQVKDYQKYQEILDKYNIKQTGSCYLASRSADIIDWSDLWWTLVAVAIFIFICCLILIVAVYILHRNYKRYMNTRKVYMVPQ